MAKPELGTKRQCQSCGAKFYDLGKDPIVCPKCGTTYTAAAIAPPTRGRAAEVANRDDDEETEEAGAGPELVSLDEVEAEESGKELPTDDDVEIEDDIAEDDDTFLEEEEAGDDDVADLIDGEIEDDEEA
ncbi:TIGR02300 family protein [Alsobacter metallidurans]|uniref:TIGR02300 family protein n=1 Tax=Alsobacter metallidurans TaxID=340221 RepID=A0A917MKA9_9HYPH|nr:TIGR02300 family protein [Alsobacter metallidurans]GGH33893.1 TIGR02300 family protein [Alsobacter metallidurans]